MYASELFCAETAADALAEEFATTLVIEPKNLVLLLDALKKTKDYSRLKKLVVVSTPGDLADSKLLER